MRLKLESFFEGYYTKNALYIYWFLSIKFLKAKILTLRWPLNSIWHYIYFVAIIPFLDVRIRGQYNNINADLSFIIESQEHADLMSIIPLVAKSDTTLGYINKLQEF